MQLVELELSMYAPPDLLYFESLPRQFPLQPQSAKLKYLCDPLLAWLQPVSATTMTGQNRSIIKGSLDTLSVILCEQRWRHYLGTVTICS
jgi:hypothetical protein